MGKVREAIKNAEFLFDILPRLLRFVQYVVYITLRNLYWVLFVSENIQQVDNLIENFFVLKLICRAKLLAA